MMDLATMPPKKLKENLLIIPGTYRNWLQKQRDQVHNLPLHLQEVANENIKQVIRVVTGTDF